MCPARVGFPCKICSLLVKTARPASPGSQLSDSSPYPDGLTSCLQNVMDVCAGGIGYYIFGEAVKPDSPSGLLERLPCDLGLLYGCPSGKGQMHTGCKGCISLLNTSVLAAICHLAAASMFSRSQHELRMSG